MPIIFRESDHTYWKDGQRVPGVTDTLKPLYGDLRFVREDILDYKSHLGRAVHKAVELHVLGGLDYSSLDGPVAAYFSQFLRFERDTGFKALHAELLVASSLGYAGQLDLVGYMARTSSLVGLLDLKCTAALSPAVALQTAAYQAAYNEEAKTHERQPARKRWALRLMPNDYRLQPYTNDAIDFAAFLGLLKISQWAKANNIELGEVK